MSLLHDALVPAYYARRAGASIARRIGILPAPSLRVLIYHDVAPGAMERFAEQMRWLSQSWRFITAERFAAMMQGDQPIEGRNLLLTFDDGYASNRVVAETVLRPMRIPAVFFIISEFADIAGRADAREFVRRRIVPGMAGSPADHVSNMRWGDLEALLEQGHTIGAHTCTHARLATIDSNAELEREIVHSADTLSDRLGTTIDHFAWPFGDAASIDVRALDIARRRFRFVHSGLRGNNAGGVSPFAVRREAAAPDESRATLGAWVEGIADFRYAASRRQVDAWVAC
jgi:peptidoglycan/xylan/chitin deacetylase (PgdA/CDA1 family)